MKTNLALVHEPTFWPFFSWREFSLMPDRARMVVIIPVTGFTDWNASLPLDFEEQFLLTLLRETLAGMETSRRFLVIPPQRFNLGTKARSFFTVDPETAHATLEEVVRSIHGPGFRKVLFLNSNPLNEDLVDSAGRDLRIALGLQPFCINLGSIGLDWESPDGLERMTALASNLRGEGSPSADSAELTAQLASLLEEVRQFRALPDEGAIPRKKALS
ncbi:MAG TPA: creatininase family protein [Oceanipulchritudo sp.]|nr:creatininase family protein [Oceanipulchritudo sp.]